MSIKRVGATKEYASNWELAFGKKESERTRTSAKAVAKKPKRPKQKSSATTKKTRRKSSA